MGRNSTELAFLERTETALNIAISHPEISHELNALIYTPEKITEGHALFTTTKEIWHQNKIEHNEMDQAYKTYTDALDSLEESYKGDRKRVKAIFRNDPTTRQILGVSGSMPDSYLNKMNTYTTLYQILSENPSILTKLVPIQITNETVTSGLEAIKAVKKARDSYFTEKFESEQSTNDKDTALAELDNWMIDFKVVAKIALSDKPQLMQAFGSTVK